MNFAKFAPLKKQLKNKKSLRLKKLQKMLYKKRLTKNQQAFCCEKPM